MSRREIQKVIQAKCAGWTDDSHISHMWFRSELGGIALFQLGGIAIFIPNTKKTWQFWLYFVWLIFLFEHSLNLMIFLYCLHFFHVRRGLCHFYFFGHTTCIQCSQRILATICFALFRIVDILVKFYSTTTPISEFKRTDYMGTIGLSVVEVNKQELNFQNDEILQCIPYLHHDK